MINTYIGLSSEEVLANRARTGENILKEGGRNSRRIIYEVLKEPMIILLAVACSIYFMTGEIIEGIIMSIAILIVISISVFQQIRSEHAVKALQKLSQSLVTVFRDGQQILIPSKELVENEIVVVSEGQSVLADVVILECYDLSVDESILTGESFAIVKSEGNRLYSGTMVNTGLAYVKVVDVGNKTRIGQLGKSIQDIQKEKTSLEKQINLFVKRMALFGFIAFAAVWIYNYYESGNVLHGLMHGLTLAMAALPEEIPLALTTFMALGAYWMIRSDVIVKQPQTVEALGAATVICLDKTGTITQNKMKVVEIYNHQLMKTLSGDDQFQDETTRQLLWIAKLASEPVPFDPMEKAIHAAYDKPGLISENLRMIKEYPLSRSHPIMTHIYRTDKGIRVIACKGAPEGIINHSQLSGTEQENVMQLLKPMASRGNRVLAVATADYLLKEFPDEQTSFHWKFLGLVALSDPPKENIVSIIRSFYNAGIEVKMITGDFPETACSIARKINIKNAEFFITGHEITLMTDAELEKAVSGINVFARTMPELKLRIINALKKKGEMVAMTGDGVNDGPALKAANIGIAMGQKGSEVARQAASLVLVNDDLEGMVKAVELGRKIHANLKKAIQYIISIHIPLISIVTVPLILGWKYPNIFTPVHVIFLELVMGPTCSIVYENEPVEKDLMRPPPHKLSTNFFTWKELSMSTLQGLVITSGLLIVLYFAIHSMLEESSARAMVFTTLVFSNLFLTLTGRSIKHSLLTTMRYKNHLVPLIAIATLSLLALSLFYGPVQKVFGFSELGIKHLFICFVVAFVFVMWIEIYKLKRRNER